MLSLSATDGHDKVLLKYLKPDLAIIGDMGIKQLPKRPGEHLVEIILRRYETRSTMMLTVALPAFQNS